mgnify:CR=1 FL=1
MKNLEFNSVLIGNRYRKGFSLPDYLRENGKFSREKTLSEIVREEYGEIDEKGVKISVKNVTDEKFDCEGRRIFIAGKEINLTAKEFDVLELLVKNPNKVYSRENLLNLVWGYEYPGDVRTVDVHIRRLREKIETTPSNPKYVHTKWGVGYYFQLTK